MFDLVRALKDANPPSEAAFPDAEYGARLTRARAAMAEQGIELLLVHHVPNICYLSGYLTQMTSWYVCFCLPLEGEPFIHVNEGETALVLIHGPVRDVVTIPWRRSAEAPEDFAAALRERGLDTKRIGLETARYPLHVDTYLRLREALPGARFEDASDLVHDLRAVKSAAEIAHLRKASELTAVGMRAAVEGVRLGNTENDVAAAAYAAMVRAGAEHPSSPPVVQSGRRIGSGPHASWKRSPLARGEPVVVALAGTYFRYAAPQARTAVIGSPSDEVERLAESAVATVERILSHARPGLPMGELARRASAGLELGGAARFEGSLGRSVGLGLVPIAHEGDLEIVPGVERELEPGMVFHTDIRLSIAGRTGVALGETWLVTEAGCERLTEGACELVLTAE